MDTMFDTLLQLPLFQGLTKEDFTNILGKVKLHFTKVPEYKPLAIEGDPCNDLIYLLRGETNLVTTPRHDLFTLYEFLEGPCLLEPQAMFGLRSNYSASYYVTSKEAHILSISKAFVMKELWRYDIFRLNFANILCNRAQSFKARLWLTPPEDIEGRIAYFICQHCDYDKGRKVLKIKMDDLGRIINETRLNVSKALNKMQSDDWIELRRGEIVVPQLELLTENCL